MSGCDQVWPEHVGCGLRDIAIISTLCDVLSYEKKFHRILKALRGEIHVEACILLDFHNCFFK